MKINCDRCGEIPCAIFDGYSVGDTLLEGVMFKVYYKNNILKVELNSKDDKDYCRKLNMKYFNKEALEHAKELDIASCPNCGSDVDVPHCV